MKIKINKQKLKEKLPLMIIIFSTLLALYLIFPLFKSGIPLNIDSPCHYLRVWSILNTDASVPNNWCSYWQAGVPSSQYYIPIIDGMIAFLSLIFGLTLSYKIFLFLALLSQGIGAYFLLSTRGKKLAGAIAYAFLVLQHGSWHIAGFEETILVGMWPYVFTTGMLFLGLALFVKFLELPNKKNLVFAVIPTLFLTHPLTLAVGLISYLILSLFYYKQISKHYKYFILFIAGVLLINMYYILPLFFKISFFPSSLAGKLTWFNLYHYIIAQIPIYIFVFAFFGILLSFYFKDRKNRPIILLFFLILILTIFSLTQTPITKYMLGVRIGAFITPLIYIFAAIFLVYLFKVKFNFLSKKLNFSSISLILIVLSIILLFSGSLKFSKSVLLSDMNFFESQKEMYAYLGKMPDARVLAEETLYNFGNYPQTFTHSHCILPIYSDKEVLASGLIKFPDNKTKIAAAWNSAKNKIFGRSFDEYEKDELNKLLNDYNIKYVIAHTRHYLDYFINNSVSYKEFPPFVLFETAISPSYFKLENGKIISSEYKGTYAKAIIESNNLSYVTLKTHFYPNWKTYVNGEKSEAEDCDFFVCTKVDKGEHVVEFKYGLIFVDWLGYILTLIGIICLIYYYRRK